MTDPSKARSTTRVVIQIDGGAIPTFLASAADRVATIAGAGLVLVVVTESATIERPLARRLLDGIDAVYDRVERRVLRGGPRADVTGRRWGPPADTLVVRHRDPARLAEAVQAAAADVLIDLRRDPDRPPIPIGPWSRWRLRYSDGPDGEPRPWLTRPSVADVLARSVLSIEQPDGTVLETGAGVGRARRIGFGRDRDAILWRASLLPARRLAQIAAGDFVPTEGLDIPRDPAEPATRSQIPPALPPRAGAPFRALASFVVRKLIDRALYRSSWVVLVRERRPDQPPPTDLSGFRPVEAPAGRFHADPFVVSTPDGPSIYVEDCPDGKHRGRISALRKGPDGRWLVDRVVLDDIEHRAYPHVTRTEDGLVLTPDGGRNGGVDILVERTGSGVFEPRTLALEGVPASDPTLLWHAGRYWLFTTVTEPGMNPWDELHLFSSASIDGLWHPHPRNPIVADVRSARPAGRIFRLGDQLVRPGQDCSVAYGRRIALSAITTLTPDRYEEHPISTIEPTGLPGILRTHTYSFDGTVEAADGFRRTLRRPRRRRRPS